MSTLTKPTKSGFGGNRGWVDSAQGTSPVSALPAFSPRIVKDKSKLDSFYDDCGGGLALYDFDLSDCSPSPPQTIHRLAGTDLDALGCG